MSKDNQVIVRRKSEQMETILPICCKCDKPKKMEYMAIKHRAGENECIDCYAKSMRG